MKNRISIGNTLRLEIYQDYHGIWDKLQDWFCHIRVSTPPGLVCIKEYSSRFSNCFFLRCWWWWWKVIIVSALSLYLRYKDRLRDRESLKIWSFIKNHLNKLYRSELNTVNQVGFLSSDCCARSSFFSDLLWVDRNIKIWLL